MTLIMSVSGVRGIIGESLTPALAADLGAAFGSHLGGGTLVLGRDSRPSGESLAASVAAGLRSTGCGVIDLGIATTPGTAVMISELKAAGGVIITASHNPAPWNGIKFLTSEGFAPPPEIAESIFTRYREKRFSAAPGVAVGPLTRDGSTASRHVARVLGIVDADAIRRRRYKVVLDSVNGAGGPEGRMLLEALGCEVVHVNAEPTGCFAHTPEPTAENLAGLCDDVPRNGAVIGFAQDPDADRLAIVDDRGRYIGEEYTIALAARLMLAHRSGPVAVNLSTSRMVDDLAARSGQTVYRTAVGEANVARAVLAKKCVLGGEGNGGVIDPRVVLVRDSLVAMALVLNLLAEESRPLSAIVDEMPRYVMVKQKLEMTPEQVIDWIKRLRTESGEAKVNDVDGLRLDWTEGWVHVRPSNTEPIARVIAEARDQATADALVSRAVRVARA
jgi:phosphomannomutase